MPDDTLMRLVVARDLDDATAQLLEAVRLEEYALFMLRPSGVRSTFYWPTPLGQWVGKS